MALNKFLTARLAGAAVFLAGAQLPALAQQYAPATPAITAPSAGASVSSPVTVTYSLGDSGSGQMGGGSGSGNPSWGAHHRRPHAFLVIDSATPAAGSSIQADADHVAFPKGQFQLSVPLAPGHHQLQVVFVNKQGEVSSRLQSSASVSISVQ